MLTELHSQPGPLHGAVKGVGIVIRCGCLSPWLGHSQRGDAAAAALERR